MNKCGKMAISDGHIPFSSRRLEYCRRVLLRTAAADTSCSEPWMSIRTSSNSSGADTASAHRRQVRALLKRSNAGRCLSTSASTWKRLHFQTRQRIHSRVTVEIYFSVNEFLINIFEAWLHTSSYKPLLVTIPSCR